MTKIDAMTHTVHEGTTIYMDDGTELTDRDIAPLAEALRQNGGARDASAYIEAAWAVAHPIQEGAVVPAGTPLIVRGPEGITFMDEGSDFAARVNGLDEAEYRTLTPLSNPEPWEESRYCYADGRVYERFQIPGDIFWLRPGDTTAYRREALAKLNPRPVTIEGEAE